MERPFFFDHAGMRLFAVAHQPADRRSDVAIVFCHPYGEEKQFSYRLFVEFARRLCAAGVPSLRFDARGYGDSEGDIEDASVETQIEDTLAAVAVARAHLHTQHVILLGLRYGAIVAALTAERQLRIAGLVLWAPVIWGQRYANELVRKRLFGQIVANAQRTTEREILERLRSEGKIEIEGNYLTAEMFDRIRGMNLPDVISRNTSPVLAIAAKKGGGSDPALAALADAYRSIGAACAYRMVAEGAFWDDRHMSRWYFPEAVYDETLRWVSARSGANGHRG